MSRLAAVLLTFPIMVATAFGVLLCLYLRLATCDEGCRSSGGWGHDPAAWQWNVFLVLALVGGVAALALVTCVAGRAVRLASAWLALWTGSAVALALVLGDLGYRKQAAKGWYGIALLTLLGVMAIALADGRTPRGAQPSTE